MRTISSGAAPPYPISDTPWTLPPASATRPHQLRCGFMVQLWAPPAGHRHVAGWYEPAARCGADVERFRFVGRVERGLQPALWLYADRHTGAELLVDVDGVVHEGVADRRRRIGYRLAPVDAVGAVVLPFRRPSEVT